ncbi:uncharacterized protein LOC141686373 [Apium graveolens]|uniref:uncharacterized protein LOC141686373 n=1 Tax=Apium graveolens TaxID=4045 RepID=UPI003D7B3193
MSWERLSKHKVAGGVGFRDFRDFNLALLEKQGWRLINHLEKLSSKLYKARYFTECDFLASELGNNPTFIWRSIWDARLVIKVGARWKIGNGAKIGILGQPWLHDSVNPCITSELIGLNDATISSLMIEDGGGWDREVIEDLFNTRDQRCILATEIGGCGRADELYWNENISGDYMVKSAYQLLQKQKGDWHTNSSSQIWIYCGKFVRQLSDEETVMHILVTCPFAQQCWHHIGWSLLNAVDGNFASWLQIMFDQTEKGRRGEIVTMCWSIWKARNNMVWNEERSTVQAVVFSTMRYLADWRKAQVYSTKTLYQDVIQGDKVDSWVKPKKDEVKVTVDAAVFKEQNRYGVGMLARDDEGVVVHGRSDSYEGVVRPEFAEAIAVKEALSWVKCMAWQGVTMESDCLGVVRAIRMTSPFGSIIMECRRLIAELNIELFFIKRSYNIAVHLLTRESCLYSGRVFDKRNVLIELMNIVSTDLFE